MTKESEPVSIGTALKTIKSQLPGGWWQMAQITGYEERTVRAWGDDLRKEQINLPAAITLDEHYQIHGGIGAPLHEAYGLILHTAVATRYADSVELQHDTVELIREGGEAHATVLQASLPDASPAMIAHAQRNLLENRSIIDRMLARLGRKPP